jgi:2-oxoglutarate-dependent dioxygenase
MIQSTATLPGVVDRVKRITLDAREIGFYRREGYLFLPGMLEAATAEAARCETLEIVTVAHRVGGLEARARDGSAMKLIQSGQYLAGSTLDGIVNSPSLLAIASELLGGPSSLYLPFTAVKSGGGGGRFSFHQDNQYTRFTDGLLGLNIWFALCDMTPDNGCLQMCPRTHLRGTLDADTESDGHRRVKVDPDDFLPLRMRAGDAVAFSRLTVHGSGQNLTSRPRVGYAVQFHRDDAVATWDNQPPRPLKGASRWSVGPVAQLTPPDDKGRDGH